MDAVFSAVHGLHGRVEIIRHVDQDGRTGRFVDTPARQARMKEQWTSPVWCWSDQPKAAGSKDGHAAKANIKDPALGPSGLED
jgi:hypothetical protein